MNTNKQQKKKKERKKESRNNVLDKFDANGVPIFSFKKCFC